MQPKTRMKRKKNSKKKRFINGHLRLDKMYLFLSAFLLVLIGTNVGYAIYNNKIEESRKIEAKILDVSIYSKTIGATNLYEPSFQDKSISLNLCLSKKTDSITYLVTVKNYEEENIVLEDIVLNNTNNDSITYIIENVHEGEILPAQTAKTIKVKVVYDHDTETITNKCVGMSINFMFSK